ncbi:hypothetical protein BC835DRAFT_1027261 [Cytidiella melzeri]|nr:hypothetical protein BC835DRAFT_1027261 [Cytidiella melzeri]
MLSFVRFTLFALFATTVLAMPSATTKRMTNGERMARGLPPMPPHRRANALLARQSPTPPSPGHATPGNFPGNHPRSCQPRDGIIEVISASDQSLLGYIKNTHSGNGTYGLCSDSSDALKVHANCDNDWFDVPITNGDRPGGCDHLGGFGGVNSAGLDFVPGNSYHACLSGVAQTAIGSFATMVTSIFSSLTGISTFSQSAMWSLDDTTNIFTVGWVNHDHTRAPTFISYVAESDTLYFTGDLAEFASFIAPQVSVEVNFRLASN